jgi:hypothetical protein
MSEIKPPSGLQEDATISAESATESNSVDSVDYVATGAEYEAAGRSGRALAYWRWRIGRIAGGGP